MAIEKKFVREQVNRLLIAEFLQGETDRAGFGGIDIQRTPMGTRVSLIAERPGMVIGRRGSNIARLTTDLADQFKAENPQIEVVEAGRDANLNAKIMARKVAEALERGWHFRRAGHSTVRRIMESGAKGCIVILSGKLTGQRHRTEKFIAGHIKYNGDTAIQLMDLGYAQCKKKLGTIGCTVKIMHPDARLPDEVRVYAPGEKAAAAAAAARPAPVARPEEKEVPAEERPEGVPVLGAPQAAPTEAPEEERRSRRRVPAPQPTAEDIRDAEALAQRMAQQKRRRAATKDQIPETGSPPAQTEDVAPGETPAAELAVSAPKEKEAAEAQEATPGEPPAPAPDAPRKRPKKVESEPAAKPEGEGAAAADEPAAAAAEGSDETPEPAPEPAPKKQAPKPEGGADESTGSDEEPQPQSEGEERGS